MISAGDLIAIPLGEAGFVTGHVLLDTENKETARRLPARSRLTLHGTYLLDVYGPATPQPDPAASQSLIRGIWTDDDDLVGHDRWATIGRRNIIPEQVEFPEFLVMHNVQPMFERGEIVKFAPSLKARFEQVKSSSVYVSTSQLWRICVNLVGRGDLLGRDAILFRLSPKIDLRYSPHRDEVYRAIGADPGRSYWDWATAEGLDPGRLWSK